MAERLGGATVAAAAAADVEGGGYGRAVASLEMEMEGVVEVITTMGPVVVEEGVETDTDLDATDSGLIAGAEIEEDEYEDEDEDEEVVGEAVGSCVGPGEGGGRGCGVGLYCIADEDDAFAGTSNWLLLLLLPLLLCML